MPPEGVMMKRILKWAGIVLASLVGLLVLAVAYVFIASQRMLGKTYPKRPSTVHASVMPDQVARGAHLVVVSTCTDCHGKDLTGTQLDVPGSTLYAPNLTIMTRTLSDADMDVAIRQGLRPDGKNLLFMPSHGYASFTDDEVGSMIGYLRSLSPHGASSPETRLGLGVRLAFVLGIVRTEAAEFAHTPPPLDLGMRYEKGRHLAQVICGQCHGTDLGGDLKAPVHPRPDLLVVAGYDPGTFRTLMRTGKASGGRQTEVMSKIAPGSLSNLTDDEIGAIYDYLLARCNALTAHPTASSSR
jgi:mono/diheme cytochrome c family protein